MTRVNTQDINKKKQKEIRLTRGKIIHKIYAWNIIHSETRKSEYFNFVFNISVVRQGL